jgi:hypothetical protein
MKKIILIYFLLLSSCISIPKNNLIQKNVALIAENEVTFSFFMESFHNNSINSKLHLSEEAINFNNNNCSKESLKSKTWVSNPFVTGAESFDARQACELKYFFSSINGAKKIKILKKNDGEQLHLIIKLNSYSIGSKALTYLGMVTLFLIPVKETITQKWEVNVFKNQKEIKNYIYEDSFDIWHSLFLLPATPFYDGYNLTYTKLNKAFIDNLVFDLTEDGFLK